MFTNMLTVVSFKSLDDYDLANKPDRPWMLSMPIEVVPIFLGETDWWKPFTYNSFGHIDHVEQTLTSWHAQIFHTI